MNRRKHTTSIQKMAKTFGFSLLFIFFLFACDSGSEETDTPSADGDEAEAVAEDGDVDNTQEQADDAEGDATETPIEDGDEDLVETSDDEAYEMPIDCHSFYVEEVSGVVLEAGGEPMENAYATMCVHDEAGQSSCLSPSRSDATGRYIIDVPEAFRCMSEAALHYNSPDYPPIKTILSCPVFLNNGAIDIPDAVTLYPVAEGERDTLGDDEAVMHEIRGASGEALRIVPEKIGLFDYAYEDLRIELFDLDNNPLPCFLTDADKPDALAALLPEMDVAEPGGAHVVFPNTEELSPGERVDLYTLGGIIGDVFEGRTPIAEGAWAKVGEAVVSEDGERIESLGDGLPFLTWVGWKKQESGGGEDGDEEPPEASLHTMSVEELHRALEAKDFLLINVFTPYEGEIPETDAHIPAEAPEEIETFIGDDLGEKAVIYCRRGIKSTMAAEALVAKGYWNIFVLDGGMEAWQAAGYDFINE